MVEALLRRKEELSADQILVPELALYEVANSLWKHEHVLHDIKEGGAFLSILYGLVDAGRILVVSPGEGLMARSYDMAGLHKITVYDAVFVSLALELGLVLRTLDRLQARVFRSEGGNAK